MPYRIHIEDDLKKLRALIYTDPKMGCDEELSLSMLVD